MAITKIKQGYRVTLSTTEKAYELDGDVLPQTTVTLVLVSGTLSFGVGDMGEIPIMDENYASYSTAGEKIIVTFSPKTRTLRMKCASSGVVNVSW